MFSHWSFLWANRRLFKIQDHELYSVYHIYAGFDCILSICKWKPHTYFISDRALKNIFTQYFFSQLKSTSDNFGKPFCHILTFWVYHRQCYQEKRCIAIFSLFRFFHLLVLRKKYFRDKTGFYLTKRKKECYKLNCSKYPCLILDIWGFVSIFHKQRHPLCYALWL